MKKLFFVLLAILLFAGTAFALDMELTCPASVTAGNALSVTVKYYNPDCSNSVTVSRIMKGLVGNAGGTMGGAGIWGPYNTNTAVKVVPAATCPPGTPGSAAIMPTIISAVPASLAGTMAMVYVEALTSTGQSMGSGSCMVEIKP